MGMSAQEKRKKAQSSSSGLLQKCTGTLLLLLLWSALLKGSHTQGFLHQKVRLDIICSLGFFKMHGFN